MDTNNSLTSPADYDRTKPLSFSDRNAPSLTQEELEHASQALKDVSFIQKFPHRERFYADPPLTNQVFGLVSFTPAKGATPDKDGVYGMIKLRGNFGSEMEANGHAENLIKNVDSLHSILFVNVGRPFPLSTGKYITETKEIDIKKKITEETSASIREKRDEDARTIRELEDKQKELMEDVKEDKEVKPIERYTELAVKKAQLTFTYIEQSKKMLEMKKNILRAREEMQKMDEQFPECKAEYKQTYMEARRRAHLPDDDQSFIKYMGDDLEINLDDFKY